MALKILTKQPNEEVIFGFDFRRRMAEDEDLANVLSIVCDPAGVDISSMAFTTKVASAMFSGGADDTTYQVTCTVLTTLGQTLEMDGSLYVKEV